MAPTKSTMLWMLFLILCWKELKTKGIYEYFFSCVFWLCFMLSPFFMQQKCVFICDFCIFFQWGGHNGPKWEKCIKKGFLSLFENWRGEVVRCERIGANSCCGNFFSKNLQFIWRCFDPPDNSLLTHISTNMTTFHDGKVTGNGQKSNLRWNSGYRCWCMWWKIGLGKRVIYKKEIKNAKKGFCTLKLLNFIAIWWGLTPAHPVVQRLNPYLLFLSGRILNPNTSNQLAFLPSCRFEKWAPQKDIGAKKRGHCTLCSAEDFLSFVTSKWKWKRRDDFLCWTPNLRPPNPYARNVLAEEPETGKGT